MERTDDILAGLLDDLDVVLGRYVAFPSEAHRHAVAAWVVHCWVLETFDSTPRLALLSPEKGCGKSRALEVIELHVPDPMLTVNVSAAAMFRKVADGGVTLLLDEADTYLGLRVAKEHEDLRGLINAGHRRGAKALRAVAAGKSVKVEEYPCFAPVALAGIGDLPDTILDRSVIVPMRRRAPGEHVEPFRLRHAERHARDLAGRLEEWADRAVERMADYEPEMPDGITDRPADVWEPLIILGDYAGEEWSGRLRRAAVALNTERAERDPSLGVQLLRDIRTAFTERDRIASEDLVDALVAMDSAPWGDLRGKPIDTRGIARRLRKYGVRPGDHRFGETTRKGYLRTDLHDAWERYLPAEDVADVAHVAHPSGEGGDAECSTVAPTEDRGGGGFPPLALTGTESDHGTLPLPPPAEGQQGQHEQHGDPFDPPTDAERCPGCGGSAGWSGGKCFDCRSYVEEVATC